MSDEQQQQQLQLHQRQHQQMQQHLKTAKDNMNAHATASSNAQTPSTPTTASTSSSSSSSATSASPRKLSIHELRNQDYVSRLMAATPPYLYSAPVVGPNNFFFSDMLRSLVAARNSENARNLQLQQQQQQQHHHHQQQTSAATLSRRPRKRLWSQHRPPLYMEHLRGPSGVDGVKDGNVEKGTAPLPPSLLPAAATQPVAEKPLELTTHKISHPPLFHLAAKYRKLEESADLKKVAGDLEVKPDTDAVPVAGGGGGGAVDHSMHGTPPAASLPPQDLVLPPPPPVWYPPLYPPYGIDPLHFFIDLRVSGHIYDRKKENVSPLSTNITENANGTGGDSGDAPNPINFLNKHRQGSAFTVPVPRSNAPAGSVDPINLTSTKYYDLSEAKENQPFAGKSVQNGASYMLQHLPRLYSHFAARDFLAANVANAAASSTATDGDGETAALSDGDNKSEADCDGDSEEAGERCPSADDANEEPLRSEREIDVEIIDSIKYRTDGESSRCSSGDESGSVTQID